MKKWLKNNWPYLAVALAGITITIIVRNKLKSLTGKLDKTEPLKDAKSESVIQTLHPKIRDKAREFINKAEKQGVILRVTSGLRTWAEQDALYAKGRTAPGGIVTNARGGESNHNYGLAFDVVPIENGSVNWNSKNWDKIGEIGKSVGFKWGGDWKGFTDKPHFEMLFGNNLASLKRLYLSGNKQGDYVNIA